MEFDRSKVFTALNAEEVKVGSRGYFAYNLSALKTAVSREVNGLSGEIVKILPDAALCRFGIKDGGSGYNEYGLFYLVEGPGEKRPRPYKDVSEMVHDFLARYSLPSKDYGLPSIYIRNKHTGEMSMVISFRLYLVAVLGKSLTLDYLFDNYEYLDGTPCGLNV